MNDSRLSDLRKDFMLRYPKVDYLTLNEIFKFGDMAYCLGVDAKYRNSGQENKPVIRSDGKQYESVALAAKKNGANPSNIRKSIQNGWKCAGYHWKYADKYHRIRK